MSEIRKGIWCIARQEKSYGKSASRETETSVMPIKMHVSIVKNRNKCYKGKGEWKEIDFTKDNLEKPCKEWLKAEGKECNAPKHSAKGHYEKVKIVRFTLKPNREKMAMRMCLSEHPF